MTQTSVSTKQTDEASIAKRVNAYISFMERYPLYSTLLVLKDYEDQGNYEECSIIFNSLKKYKEKYENKFSGGLTIPTHVNTYRGEECQKMMNKAGIIVEEKEAKEKAELIKIKLPI